MNREQCCRLCMAPNTYDHLSLFSAIGIEMKLSEIISEHFKCEVSELDPLPNLICQTCWKTTESFHELYQKSKTVEETFLSSSIKVEPDEMELVPGHEETNFVEELRLEVGPIKIEPTQDESNFSGSDADDNSYDTSDSDENIENENDEESDNAAKSNETKRDYKLSNRLKGIKMKDREDVQYDKLFAEHKHRFNMQCDFCPRIFETLTDAKKHYAKEHNTPKGYIRCCKFKLKFPYQVVRHLRKHVPRNTRTKKQCKLCLKLFDSKYFLKKHMREHEERNESITEEFKQFVSENYDVNCDKCDTIFETFHDADQHYKESHGDERGYLKCKRCKTKVKRFSMLKRHTESHPENFKCDLCPKVFPTRNAINQHKKRHKLTMDKPFICDYCGQNVRDKMAITRHIFSKHMDHLERKFECEICHKKFHILKLLTVHIYAAHQEKKRVYTCEICGQSYYTNYHLTKHKIQHLDKSERLIKTTQCKYCFEWLFTKSGVFYHKQKHESGPQTCEHCKMELPNRVSLLGHIRQHHRAHKFKCNYCQKTFSVCSQLKKHEESHTRHKIYMCQFCDKSFTVQGSRRTHQKRDHPQELKQLRETKKLEKLPKAFD